MSSSTTGTSEAAAQQVRVTDWALVVELIDARTVSAPLSWHPRLLDGTGAERDRWRLIGRGKGIHWPDLDEDISVVDLLLAGRGSGESQNSLRRWLDGREEEAP